MGARLTDLIASEDGPELLPRVILLDVRQCGMDGFELLRQLKSNERTRQIPVVVWVSPAVSGDTREAYRLGANSCVARPAEAGPMAEIAAELEAYWLTLNVPPVD